MRFLRLVPFAAALAFAAPALASDADPEPALCKEIAAVQFGSGAMELVASNLTLAFEPEDEQALLIEAKAKDKRKRAAALGYALSGEAVALNSGALLDWQVGRLDKVFAACQRKFAALLQASARQKWVVLDTGNPGTKLAADVLNIRTIGSRRAINLMLGFAEPFDGGDGRHYGATVDTFTFDCAARGNALATLQILFTTEFEQHSLAPGADPFPYGPDSQLAQYERLACGDVTPGNDLQSAPDMEAAARMLVGLAESGA